MIRMAFQVIVALTVLIAGFIPSVHTIGWNYDGSGGDLGPNDWMYNYSMCDGNSQSPINIDTTNTSDTTATLTFSGYNTSSPSQNYTITNTGHSVQINVNVKTISLKNSRVDGTFVLEQLHFHWGDTGNNGSEHSINGQYYPLEIHMVHYNSAKYNNVSDAAGSNDSSAIIVLGVFVNVTSTGTSQSNRLGLLSDMFDQVRYQNNKTTISSFPLDDLIPRLSQCQNSTLYTYSGSLTTPPCAQVVNWNIFAQPIYISSSQLSKFRQVYGDNPTEELTHNFRPVQSLNDRTVYKYNIMAPCNPTANGAELIQSGHLIALLWLAILSVMIVSQ